MRAVGAPAADDRHRRASCSACSAGVALWLVAGDALRQRGRRPGAGADRVRRRRSCSTTPGRTRSSSRRRARSTRSTATARREARSYDVADEPQVDLTLSDASGRGARSRRATGPSYDRGGRRGEGVRTVDIESTGDYVLTASRRRHRRRRSAVGRDPSSGVAAIRVAAVLVLLAGVVGGIILLVAGRPRRAPAPIAPAGTAVADRPQPGAASGPTDRQPDGAAAVRRRDRRRSHRRHHPAPAPAAGPTGPAGRAAAPAGWVAGERWPAAAAEPPA